MSAAPYNVRLGYRVCVIDRTRFYVCNDELRWSSGTFRTRERAEQEAARLNAKARGDQ